MKIQTYKSIGFAIYNTKRKRFCSYDGKWIKKPNEFFTFKNCLGNIDGGEMKNCIPKEIFYYWEE